MENYILRSLYQERSLRSATAHVFTATPCLLIHCILSFSVQYTIVHGSDSLLNSKFVLKFCLVEYCFSNYYYCQKSRRQATQTTLLSCFRKKSEEPPVNQTRQKMIHSTLAIHSQAIPVVTNACMFYYRINVI
jgi:hypothetical protein